MKSENNDAPGAPASAWDALRQLWPKRRAYQIALVLAFLGVTGAYEIWTSFPDTAKDELLHRVGTFSPASDASDVAFLADDFVIDLHNAYDRPTLTKVDIQVKVSRGTIVPLREAQLLKFDYDRSKFDQVAANDPRIVTVTPSAASFSTGDASGIISVEFDSRSLIPLGDFTARFRPGDRQSFGNAVVRLWFQDTTRRSADVDVPLMFEKRGD